MSGKKSMKFITRVYWRSFSKETSAFLDTESRLLRTDFDFTFPDKWKKDADTVFYQELDINLPEHKE